MRGPRIGACFVLALGLAIAAAGQAIPRPSLEGADAAVVEQVAAAIAAVESSTPENAAAAWGELGLVYHAYDFLDAAAEAYAQAAARTSGAGGPWHHLRGVALAAAGRLDESAAALRQALAAAPTAWTWEALGNVLVQLGSFDEADAAFRHALALRPGGRSAAAEAGLGQIALSHERWSEAIERFRAALALAPQATRLHHPLALALRGAGEREQAAAELALAGPIGVRPDDPWLSQVDERRSGVSASLIRGRLAFRAGSVEEAIAWFRRAVEADPRSVVARINLAAALHPTGATGAADAVTEAETHLDIALRLDPSNTTARYNLALLLVGRGRDDEALPHLEAVAAAWPQDAEVRAVLEQVRARLAARE